MQGKKPGTETASFDAYYFRNLPKIHVDAARVPVHNGMHASPVGLLLILTKRVWSNAELFLPNGHTRTCLIACIRFTLKIRRTNIEKFWLPIFNLFRFLIQMHYMYA